jgi:hypothetical protein
MNVLHFSSADVFEFSKELVIHTCTFFCFMSVKATTLSRKKTLKREITFCWLIFENLLEKETAEALQSRLTPEV